ncbi:alanine/glycine:cation symporter family protein [Fusobacterium hwasookii]|uniref:Sodium:alanine symporter n=3 Tax=Fusobacterium hwasookii TaxID=1583098 RepID=A0A0S2ZLK2_9FUSO|nr:alanine/glycine:cation symporter family protein [Fusobacterium hwasookii]ALQ35237.1 sodium:alanine symporter [Fusobacterium hwasookii ChDC F206]ALQ38136.1 sodium:alanine symporter [Fusobacterium hwasookii ChDC F300]ALQ39840.1 sodium:alanine symporter [Fusobacterium hwasookii ChDC F174]EJU06742.1 amino acid carrier protein [Fusobacterium hwasookii ChDC F128]QNE66764.1 alanine:cation symporter family protein [Fusobacterium hwasookii]
MDFLNSIIGQINTVLWSYVLIALLILSGLFYTIRTGFAQGRLLGDMVALITGKLSSLKDGEKKVAGQVTGFQAFCIAVASHVGTGNLAGVAIAVVVGGPGALFWMWIIALLGGATSLIENTLAQTYKVKEGNGFRGGPSYYMEKALGQKTLGYIFSVIVIVTFAFVFNTVQANTIAQAFETSFNMSSTIAGIILAGLTALIIFGGLNRIANVVGYMVPIMAIGYVVVALYVLVVNIVHIPGLFMSIIEAAFGLKQAVGGAIGVAMLQGIKRGLYSNEAGMGSAPNAAATSNVSHPVKQGLLQAFGVFVDTILICSATGFIVLLYPEYNTIGEKGIKLTQLALSHSVGNWGAGFITLCIFLFAFSSLVGNYYYGEANLEFLTKSKTSMLVFRVLTVACVYLGSVASLGLVWDIADVSMGIMALMNIVVIAILSPKAVAIIRDYIKQRKEGKNPVFRAKDIPGLENTECWDD